MPNADRSCRLKNCSSCRRPLSASNGHGARRLAPPRAATKGGQPSSSGSSSSAGSRRSEEHTSELQSLMRISYAGFCLKKKTEKQLRRTKIYEEQLQALKK